MPTLDAADVTAVTTAATSLVDTMIDNAVLLIGVTVVISAGYFIVNKVLNVGRGRR